MHKSYPQPSNWQDFERLCRDLYAAIWKDDGAQLNGRNGDDQAGVDVFGRDRGSVVGVQCKLREQWTAAKLTASQVRKEAEKARLAREGEGGPRKIDLLVIATTAMRCNEAQEEAHRLTEDDEIPFAVRVDAWDELNEFLNQHTAIRDDYMGWDSSDAAKDYVRERDNYLQSLCERLRPLPMAAIHKDLKSPPTLDQVYTAMDVEFEHSIRLDLERARSLSAEGSEKIEVDEGTLLPQAGTGNHYIDSLIEHLRGQAAEEEAEHPVEVQARRLKAVEFVAARQHAVLLGPPGSGKSAFLRFVALCLAGARLGNGTGIRELASPNEAEKLSQEAIWPFGALIPLVVDLRAFTKDEAAFPKEDAEIHAAHLLDHLTSEKAQCRVPESFLPHLRSELLSSGKGRGVLLLLDGLDETSDQSGVRQRIKAVIQAFVREYPNARVLVTSRPYAYQSDAEWRLPGFQDETLAELSQPAIERFVHAWYAVLADSGTLGTTSVGDGPRQLLGRLREPSLKPLGKRPLTLTLVTTLHASGMMGAGGRAEVYDRSIELFFDRWNDVRLGDDEPSFQDRFGLERSNVLETLQRIAFRVHSEQATSDPGGEEAAQIPFDMIWDELLVARASAPGVTQADLLEHLDERSGILLAEGNRSFRFPHRSFQEYLAAQHLNADEDFPEQLVATVRQAPTHWREVLAFCVLGQALPGRTSRGAWDIVQDLLDERLDGSQDDDSYRIAIILAGAFVESSKLRHLEGIGKRHQAAIETLRKWLVACLEAGALTAEDRIQAGEHLGKLGDPRLRDWQGNLLKVPGTEVALGRFLVTVQEFEAFVCAGGYEESELWQFGDADEVRRRNGWSEPKSWSTQLHHPNRPVVGVSWFEAVAYCSWLARDSGVRVRLPRTEERDRAAKPDDRKWPWGDALQPTEEVANFNANVGHATSVGCYAAGVGEFGHLDLGGNVWEWCAKDREDVGNQPLRGGAWFNDADYLRADSRVDDRPEGRSADVGFRVCAPASRPSSP